MKKYNLLMTTVLLSTLSHLANAVSFTDALDGQFDIGEHLAENAYGFLPIPMIITEPALGYGGGVVGLFMHETEEEKQKRKEAAQQSIDGGAQLMPSAVTVVGAAGTANGSWFAFAAHQHSWLNDSIRYVVAGGGGRINLDIYNDISLGGSNYNFKYETESKGLIGFQHVKFRIADSPLMIGGKQLLSKSSMSLDNDFVDGILDVIGFKDYISSGLGLTIEYDTRNNIFLPTNGFNIAAEYMVYDDKIGSDWNYSNFSFDGEGYVPIAEKWILAFAGNYQYFSTEHFIFPPTIRPYVALRGVPAFRYQGDEVASFQTQLTYMLTHRWLLSGFYGIGFTNTSGSDDIFKQEDATDSVNSYGVGFRYQIARRYGLYIGADIALSDEDSAFYINVGSGF